MIDVQRLRVLREVARHGSFSKAAAALRFTPSAVSQQIAALERTLGAAVVDRSTRGVVLTESGRLLVEAAEVITAELHHAQRRIEQLTTRRTRLTIATFTSGGRKLLPAALTAFTADHPEAELVVLEREPEFSLPLLREGQADIALAYHFDGPLPVRAGLTWTPIRDDPMWMVLPAGHPYASRAELDLADLAGERWVMGCMKTSDYLHRYAARAGFELTVAASTTDYFFAQALVSAGVGVALIPEVALDPAADIAAVPVTSPRPARHIGIAMPRRDNPLAEALRAHLLSP
ncbi:LysR family transcriptional regulator [Longispora albida]|uniref:LysR family transcriptional regulator n=1 Tax=Longispora albida TaxID=203523 RepID=UPI0003695CA3|nr:LysR family transcriptional regulator [Longispora albida]